MLLFVVTALPWLAGRERTVSLLKSRLAGVICLAVVAAGLWLGYQHIGWLSAIGLLVAQTGLMVALSTVGQSRRDRPNVALALGGLIFLILSFSLAFAFTYPYTLAMFKGAGLPVMLVSSALACLPILFPTAENLRKRSAENWLPRGVAALAGLILVTAFAFPRPLSLKTAGPTLRAATYNIHYGYDTPWHLSLEAQARAIEAAGADIVALQEVDAGRATSYMIDDALWLGRRLGMAAVYQPTVEHLTGIGLLSRFPVLEIEGRMLPAEEEPTAILRVRLLIGDQPVDAYAVWLGLTPEERAAQIEAALRFIQETAPAGPATFGGDFNSTPDSPVYAAIAATGFTDPFVALGRDNPPTSPAINPEHRIDFVWLRGLTPIDAVVSASLASDHRMVVVEGKLP